MFSLEPFHMCEKRGIRNVCSTTVAHPKNNKINISLCRNYNETVMQRFNISSHVSDRICPGC